jgi:hypothetical protein
VIGSDQKSPFEKLAFDFLERGAGIFEN